jgi:CheY-like chemotaxis protein
VELQGEGMSRTILLADDSPTIQKVVELTFVDSDFTVEAVSNGDELLAKLPETRPDIIVCDVIMPGTDGYDVCQQVKSDPESLHIPVILLTGTFEPFDRDRAVAAGCSEIITKPFEARKLVEVVERLAGSGIDVAMPAVPETGTEVFDGAVAPPVKTDQPPAVPESLEAGSAEFGTMLAPPPVGEPTDQNMVTQAAGDDALDFTSSGFAEMEAAAEAGPQIPEPPSDGLEYDAEITEASFEAPDVGGETTQPIPSEALDEATTASETQPPEDGLDPFSAPAETFEAPVVTTDDPFAAAVPEFEPPADADDQLPEDQVSFGDMDDEPTVTSADDGANEASYEPDPMLDGESVADDTADMPAPPVAVPVANPTEVAPAPAPAATTLEAPRLSDEDIDRIARRVLELSSDTLERIAWDVVPDMAEIVVRERVRQIEDEVGRSGG